MNLLKLSWKNITFKPLNATLSILLFALGIGLISLLLLMQRQLQENFERNLAGVDLVLGAKGSPLQLMLSSMYHIDAPTGNVTLQEVRPFFNPKHPIIEAAVPLSLGDSYRGYRIVGTTHNILDWYEAEVATGNIWQANFEATIGATAARALDLQIGDTFRSSHGLVTGGELDMEHDQQFRVVGILEPTGTVIDQLLLTTPQSFWLVHDHGPAEAPGPEAEETEHDHDDHDHADATHEHGDHADHDHAGHAHGTESASLNPAELMDEPGEKEITSVLLRFKGRNYQALNMQRNINENTDLLAATPAIEINRLFSLFGQGERALRILAFVIIFVSGLSIFISLYSSLRERRYELALMRVLGGGRITLFFLIVLEGMLLALIGYVLGILLSHGGVELAGAFIEDSYRYSFTGWRFLSAEGWLLLAALGIGFLASILPAMQASRTDISETLSRG